MCRYFRAVLSVKKMSLENLLINAIDGVQSKEFYVLKMDKMLTLHTNSRR